MKLVMDERIKHRLIGLAVVISLGAIFAPAIMKKSSQRFDTPTTISVKLPARPNLPEVSRASEQTLFESAKVAHVDIQSSGEDFQPATTIAKAEPLSPVNENKPMELAMADIDNPNAVKATMEINQPEAVSAQLTANRTIITKPALPKMPVIATKALEKPQLQAVRKKEQTIPKALAVKKPVVKKPQVAVKVNKAPASTKSGYAVQVALFTKQSNAISLVNKLKSKGFNASYNRYSTATGVVYKVLVGQSDQKEQAQKVKSQLASAMQIKGFIVPTTGIS